MNVNKTGACRNKIDENGDLYIERITNANGDVERLSPESLNYVKNLDVTVIFSRTVIDPISMTEKTGYFKQTLYLSFENPKQAKFCYFYFQPKEGMQNVGVKDFDSGFCSIISLNRPKPQDYRIYEIHYGKITRITREAALKLLIAKEALLFSSESLDSVNMGQFRV